MNIKVKDIDFENKSIRIFGKGKKERIVLFGDQALKLINIYLDQRGFTNEYLILNNRGNKITTRGVDLIIHKKLNIKRLWGSGGMPSSHSAFVTSLATTYFFNFVMCLSSSYYSNKILYYLRTDFNIF